MFSIDGHTAVDSNYAFASKSVSLSTTKPSKANEAFLRPQRRRAFSFSGCVFSRVNGFFLRVIRSPHDLR